MDNLCLDNQSQSNKKKPFVKRVVQMNHEEWSKREPIKNFFPVPNEVFLLGLSPGELAVYSYLLFCEDRSAYQCWPSFKTIGKATGMSTNTVHKYVRMLEDRGLIATEPTSIIMKDGQKRDGNLLFTIRPIQEAVEQFCQQQLEKVSLNVQREKASTQECPA